MTITPIETIDKFVKQSLTYARYALYLFVITIPIIFLPQVMAGSRDWSAYQLWLSISNGYFLNDPILYLVQQPWGNSSYSFFEGFVGLSIVLAMTAGGYLLVGKMFRKMYSGRSKTVKNFLPSISGSIFSIRFSRVQGKIPREFRSINIKRSKLSVTAYMRGKSFIFITDVNKSIPHIIIDAKSVSTPLLKNVNKRIEAEKQHVIDGVSDLHFRIYTSVAGSSYAYTLLNEALASELVSSSNAADIEFVNGKMITVYTAKDITRLGGTEFAVREIERIKDVFEKKVERLQTTRAQSSAKMRYMHEKDSVVTKLKIGLIVVMIPLYLTLAEYVIKSDSEYVLFYVIPQCLTVYYLYKHYLRDLI